MRRAWSVVEQAGAPATSARPDIGVLKTAYLDAQLGATERDLMRRIKAAFDPTGILNPGRAH